MQTRRASAIKESYEDYEFKDRKHKFYVNKVTYSSVLKRFFEIIARELIVSGDEIVMPSRVGSLQIKKYKPKNKQIDFHTTNKVFGERNKDKPLSEWKLVYFKNRHTNGYKVKLHWSRKDHANFRNKKKWSFKFTRPNIRPNSYNNNNPEVSLVSYIMENGLDHYHEYVIT